jgi:hypothetical protein
MSDPHHQRHSGLGSLVALLVLISGAAAQAALVDLLAVLLVTRLAMPLITSRHAALFLVLGLGLVLALIALADIADRSLLYFFARPLNLQFDIYLLPALWDLLRDSSGLPAALFGALLLGVLLGGLSATYAWLLSKASAGLTAVAPTAVLVMAAVITVVLIPLDLMHRVSKSAEISRELHQAAVVSDADKRFERELAIAAVQARALPGDLRGLAGQDFILFFVESYGRLLWDDPAIRPAFQKSLLSIEDELLSAGYHIASRYLRSPTFGGASWLAHMSVMSGVDSSNQTRWERLLASDVAPLPVYFRERGYETISVMPAMHIDSWPEGEYFGFTRKLWARELDYRGQKYAWSPMPDQFTLLRFQELGLNDDATPVFAEVAMTSSHSPFSVRPPFHQGAWNRDALESTLATVDPNSIPRGWRNLTAENYRLAVTYSLRSVSQFLAQHYKRSGTLVILGDHQATKAVHDVDSRALGHLWDAPIHILTRDATIYASLLASGFNPGINPKESTPSLPMQTLKSFFLNLFHAPVEPSE